MSINSCLSSLQQQIVRFCGATQKSRNYRPILIWLENPVQPYIPLARRWLVHECSSSWQTKWGGCSQASWRKRGTRSRQCSEIPRVPGVLGLWNLIHISFDWCSLLELKCTTATVVPFRPSLLWNLTLRCIKTYLNVLGIKCKLNENCALFVVNANSNPGCVEFWLS